MFRRILVPLDGSALAEAVLPQVEELASLHGSEVVLLRVALAHSFPGSDPTQAQVQAVEEASGYLGGIEQAFVGRGIKALAVVRYGHAAEEILDHAQRARVDLIAMSTHGRSGIRRWMLGSVAEKVVRAAPVPVLLLRASLHALTWAESPQPAEVSLPRTGELPTLPAAVHHILCPVDFSPESREILDAAASLALRFQADLTVLHAVYDPLEVTCSHIPHPPLEQLREEMVREAERTLQHLLQRELRRLPRAKAMVAVGRPFEQITRFARAHAVDLIVMGTHGRSGLDHWVLGSTAEQVVRKAHCAVMSIRGAA